jgi:hypothetical protein
MGGLWGLHPRPHSTMTSYSEVAAWGTLGQGKLPGRADRAAFTPGRRFACSVLEPAYCSLLLGPLPGLKSPAQVSSAGECPWHEKFHSQCWGGSSAAWKAAGTDLDLYPML